MRVILLGASGKVGMMLRNVWRLRLPSGWELLPVARRGSDEDMMIWAPGERASALGSADAVVAAWGVTGTKPERLGENTLLAQAAVDLARRTRARRVVHFSTAAIYGGGRGLKETCPPRPGVPYGYSKLEAERAMLTDVSQGDAPAWSVALRLGNVAGADSLFSALRPGRHVCLDRFPNGCGPARSYLSPSDLAAVVEVILRTVNVPRILNVAAPDTTDMAALACAAGCGVTWREAPVDALQHMHLDTGLLRQIPDMPMLTADPEELVASAREAGGWP